MELKEEEEEEEGMHLETVINFRDGGPEFASSPHHIEIGEARLLVFFVLNENGNDSRRGEILRGKSRETGRVIPCFDGWKVEFARRRLEERKF